MVSVERALEETAAGVRFKPPKTKHGRRSIPIPRTTVDMLREHRKLQLEQRIQLGLGRAELVFCDEHDRPLRADRITFAWKQLGTGVKFHALRHTYASVRGI